MHPHLEPKPPTETTMSFPKRFATVLLYLFKLEDVLVEVVMQAFVGIIYAKLLETVLRKVFKAEDVQHANVVSLKGRDSVIPTASRHHNAVVARRTESRVVRRSHLMISDVLLGQQRVIDLQHDPVEQTSVQTLRHRVPCRQRLQK